MRLARSAHLDTFCRDRLPPPDQWPEFRFDLPELNYPERLNCAVELLDATAARDGADRPCLHSAAGAGAAGAGAAGGGAAGAGAAGAGETWTYGEVVRRTNQLAQVLTEDFGLRPGNRVLLRGPNAPWLAVAWLAVIKAGGVAVTTMALLRPREIATIVGLTQPSLALCDHRFAGDLAAAAPALTALHYGPGRTAQTSPAAWPPGARPRTARSPRSIPLPTTWPCSRRPRAPPASRRWPCTSTGTCWPPPTPFPGT